MPESESWTRAREAIADGDARGLRELVEAHPRVISERSKSKEVPYDGYFYAATLLHHVAGNPAPQPLPLSAPECAAVLLDAGADIDARTRGGPSQPDDPGWSTLGLVATSTAARELGIQKTLMDLLLERGADIDDRRRGGAHGLPIVGALYYGETAAAAYLQRRGALVDMVVACGLGKLGLARMFVHDGGRLSINACALIDYTLVPRDPQLNRDEILSLCLVHAAMGGHVQVLRWLVELDADVNAIPDFDHLARPLHWAAIRGHLDAVRILLELGADPTLRDATHDGTAADWADHAGHDDVAALLAASSPANA